VTVALLPLLASPPPTHPPTHTHTSIHYLQHNGVSFATPTCPHTHAFTTPQLIPTGTSDSKPPLKVLVTHLLTYFPTPLRVTVCSYFHFAGNHVPVNCIIQSILRHIHCDRLGLRRPTGLYEYLMDNINDHAYRWLRFADNALVIEKKTRVLLDAFAIFRKATLSFVISAALEGGGWSATRPGRTLPRAEGLIPTGSRSRTVQLVVGRCSY